VAWLWRRSGDGHGQEVGGEGGGARGVLAREHKRGKEKGGGSVGRHLLTARWKEGGPEPASTWRREKDGGGGWHGGRRQAPARGRRARVSGAWSRETTKAGALTCGPGATIMGGAV
jgi:hypothetical protein